MKKLILIILLGFAILSCSNKGPDITITDEFLNDFIQASDSDVDFLKGFIENENGNSRVWSKGKWDYENVLALNKPNQYEALIVNQVGVNPNNVENIAMSFIKKDGVMLSSFVTKTISVSENIKKAEYYNIDGDLLFTTEFNNLTKTIKSSRPNSDLANGIFRKVSMYQDTDCEASFGQAVVDCLDDIYTKRGWLSVWAWVQTAYIPATGIALALDCAYHNWPGGDQCYEDFGWSN